MGFIEGDFAAGEEIAATTGKAADAGLLATYASAYRTELLDNVLPFWLRHAKDEEQGGYFNSLDRQGKVFDTDKFMWMQGRAVWAFSTMYNLVEQKQEWLDMALHGADFMEKHGRDAAGNWFFSLNREGSPLVQPYNIFSDCFAAMGFAALDKANPCDRYKDIALNTFNNIIDRQLQPKGIYSKLFPGTRPMRNFSLPMILSNLALEMEHLLGTSQVDAFIPGLVSEVMDVFYQPAQQLILENVLADGSFSDSYEGRIVNPGHSIEAMWFMMDLGKRTKDEALIRRAVDIMLTSLEYGWDHEYGGIVYFRDVLNKPPLQLEWDQKLWWVHVESLVALAKGYAFTRDNRCLHWFTKVHDYTWQHFRDPVHGEWFGYLNRRGEVLIDLKGGKWKGCFHVPRALYQVATTFDEVVQKAALSPNRTEK